MTDSRHRRTFPKKERLCGKNNISGLLAKGRHGNAGCLRYCYLLNNGQDCDRIMVSVPKKLFRRAVKRNLLKRRLRESFRLQKNLISTDAHADIMFVYNTKEVLPLSEIHASVGEIIARINKSEGKD